MTQREFRLPDAGEGLAEAEILAWRVRVGDEVSVNQVLVEVETAKAVVELPSPFAGTVVALLAVAGDVVPVGTPIIRIEEKASGVADAAGGTLDGSALLVGYGPTPEAAPRRRPRATPHGSDHVEPGPPGERSRPTRYGGLEQARAVEQRLGNEQVPASPPVRRLAHDLGVDLAHVPPTGPAGSVTREDVTLAARGDGSRLLPLTHVERTMARAMTSSAFSAPHVTQWLDVDVTATSDLLRRAPTTPGLSAVPLTPLTVAALALVRAAVSFPRINASLDSSGQGLRVHSRVHLGVAVDSPRGLLVPHVPDAQDLDLPGLAEALTRVIRTARAGRSRPEDLRGSTITLTNIGVLGMDGGTPILNPGEVAILALGRILSRPWVVEGAIVVRDVVTLSMSFDHRVVDGALAASALQHVAEAMSDPTTLLGPGTLRADDPAALPD